MVEFKGALLVVMPLKTFLDVATQVRQFVFGEPAQVEAPQILPVVFSRIDEACMLGEKLQKRIVPKQGSVFGVKDAHCHLKLVQGNCNQSENRNQRLLEK